MIGPMLKESSEWCKAEEQWTACRGHGSLDAPWKLVRVTNGESLDMSFQHIQPTIDVVGPRRQRKETIVAIGKECHGMQSQPSTLKKRHGGSSMTIED